MDPWSRKVGKGKRGTGRVVAAKDGSWLTYGEYGYLLRSTDVSSNQTESGSFCKPAWYLMYSFFLSSFALLALYEPITFHRFHLVTGPFLMTRQRTLESPMLTR